MLKKISNGFYILPTPQATGDRTFNNNATSSLGFDRQNIDPETISSYGIKSTNAPLTDVIDNC